VEIVLITYNSEECNYDDGDWPHPSLVEGYLNSSVLDPEWIDLCNVNVNDKTREWRVLSDDYRPKLKEVQENSQKEEVEIVESQIVKRAAVKKSKSYQEANAIRDDLQDAYSVLVGDKTKEWKIVSSKWNSRFAAEAALSQSSSFKQKQVESAVDEEFDSIFNRVKGELGLQPDLAETESNVVSIDVNDEETDSVVSEEEHISLPSESAPSRDELMALPLPLLKDMVREAGLPVSGKKADLVDRLLSWEKRKSFCSKFKHLQ